MNNCFKCNQLIKEGHVTRSGKLYCWSCWYKVLEWLKTKPPIEKTCYFCKHKVLIWTDKVGYRDIGLCLFHYKRIYETSYTEINKSQEVLNSAKEGQKILPFST